MTRREGKDTNAIAGDALKRVAATMLLNICRKLARICLDKRHGSWLVLGRAERPRGCAEAELLIRSCSLVPVAVGRGTDGWQWHMTY